MNISLPEALKAHVDEQVAAGAYGSSSEYVRALIRKDRDAKKLRDLLLEGPASGPGVEIDKSFFDDLRSRIKTAPNE